MDGSAMPAGVVAEAAAAAGAYLRLAGDEEAGVLRAAAASALALGEAFCGQVLVRRGCEDVLGVRSDWQALGRGRVASIAGLTGLPADGAPFVLPVEAYAVDIDADGTGWVRVVRPGAAGRVAVSYVAGLSADWAGLPEPVAQGVAMLAAHLFQNRDADGVPPAAVTALWRPYRRLRLASALRDSGR